MRKIYIVIGSVRGECEHTHRTIEGASKCALKDHRACARLSGGAYSDREVEIYEDILDPGM